MWGIIKRAAENKPLWPNAVPPRLRMSQNYYNYYTGRASYFLAPFNKIFVPVLWYGQTNVLSLISVFNRLKSRGRWIAVYI